MFAKSLLLAHRQSREMSRQRRQVVAERITDECHENRYGYETRPVERSNDWRRCGGTDVRSRSNCDAVYVDPEDLRTRDAKRTVDEYPYQGTEQERGRLAETLERCFCASAGNEYVDQRRARHTRKGPGWCPGPYRHAIKMKCA